jgi:ornithine carbamoyltransferase
MRDTAMDAKKYYGRDMIILEDYSPEEIAEIIDFAAVLKNELKSTGRHAEQPLAHKIVAMYFEKQSLRTRASFEVGIRQLGGNVIFIHSSTTHSGRGEPLMDMARVLSRYVQGIVYRAFRHEDVLEMARFSDVPVVNALCDRAHPCQALADLFTIYEHKGRGKIKVAYVGDGANNVAASLITILMKSGIDFTIGCPDGYKPKGKQIHDAEEWGKKSGARLDILSDPKKAVRGADIVYTDVWISMGDERETERRLAAFRGYTVDSALMAAAAPGALFMHDMPAHRGEEVTAEVFDGPSSIAIDQAENRLHAQKAVLALLMGEIV